MPITFDTLEELKEFWQSFNLEGGKRPAALKAKAPTNSLQKEQESEWDEDDTDEAVSEKRSQKVSAEKESRTKNARSTYKVDALPKRKGRPPSANKMTLAAKPKRDKSQTLTAKIQNCIQNYIDKNASFTANDVYQVLAKKDDSINKQSVITSVLKQMNSVYSNISVSERPGNGPRPVKLYNAN
jgi:hypothetical protein